MLVRVVHQNQQQKASGRLYFRGQKETLCPNSNALKIARALLFPQSVTSVSTLLPTKLSDANARLDATTFRYLSNQLLLLLPVAHDFRPQSHQHKPQGLLRSLSHT